MLTEMRDLGFERVELSHGIRVSLVPGILKAVADGVVTISSIHNFCPLPAMVQHAAPNLFQPSTGRKYEERLWERYTRETITFAKRIEAPHIVMHSGSIPVRFRDPTKLLESPIDEVGEEKRESARAFLKRRAEKTLPRVVTRYRSVCDAATEAGVLLGAENREGILEFPLDEGFPSFFAQFDDDDPVRYWHDTGHARIKHEHGLLDHETHLRENADRLIGFHLHDVVDGHDHQVPGTGAVDFAMVARFVRDHHTLVLEPSPRLSREDIRTSRDFLLEKLG